MSSPSRPACLLHIFANFSRGGVPIRISTVINRFGRKYRHIILSMDGNLECRSRIDPSNDVAYIDPGFGKIGPVTLFPRIFRLLRLLGPDLLLTYNWGAVEWAIVNRFTRCVPHIHLESGFGPEEADGQLSRRVRVRRIALAKTRLLVVPSFTLVSIARDVWRFDPSKTRHIPNGVDFSLFDGVGDEFAAPGFHRRPGELVIGTVAPLRPEKNIRRLIRVFSSLRTSHPVRLLIVGDGTERTGLEMAAREFGVADRVVFTGHVENPEKLYPLMDIFALSSDTEQMPNALIQAMAASRPVAAVDVGDVKANLSPENRPLIVSRTDEGGFAVAVERLLGDPALRVRLAAANRRHVVEHYSAERMFAEYGRVFDETLALSRHA